MSQSEENFQTDGRLEGRTEGQKDRPYFIGPFWLLPGVQIGFFLNSCSNIFQLPLYLQHSKQILNYLTVSERCILKFQDKIFLENILFVSKLLKLVSSIFYQILFLTK